MTIEISIFAIFAFISISAIVGFLVGVLCERSVWREVIEEMTEEQRKENEKYLKGVQN
ncbi:MAG: hypothetical protein RBR88_06815 [Candidatus Saccharicenans sp.]|jgi:tagatose-1,6-bisphosphate aldolase|nr:hypothetical protein [Candidatus Saccharicenans sp.]